MQAFEILRQKLVVQLQYAHPGCRSELTEWTGREVEYLQEDLRKSVNGRISERWFYNYLKPAAISKLPRLDMLDLLSTYVGSENWETFVSSHFDLPYSVNSANAGIGKLRKALIGFLLLALISGLIIYYQQIWSTSAEITHRLILSAPDGSQTYVLKDIKLKLLVEKETPRVMDLDSTNAVTFKGNKSIELVISGPYIKTDTVIRSFTGGASEEKLIIEPDNYALLIHHMSSVELTNWEEKEEQLNMIFANDAQVYQVMPGDQLGMELYNKQQFIRKLIFPVNNLKNIQIIDVVYSGDKISKLKFVSND